MWKLEKYIFAISIVAGLLFGSCRKEVIIPKDKMAEIITDFYLADQYISVHHKYSAQRDSSRLFAAIINEYGYTADDYRRSASYYLERKDSYKNILLAAKDILTERQQFLKDKISREDYENDLMQADTGRFKDNAVLRNMVELRLRQNRQISVTDTIPSDTVSVLVIDNCFNRREPYRFTEFSVGSYKDSASVNVQSPDSLKSDTLKAVKQLEQTGQSNSNTDIKKGKETKANVKDPRIISWEEEDSNKEDQREIK